MTHFLVGGWGVGGGGLGVGGLWVEEAEVDVQPRVDAVLTGRFPANSSVAPDDFTAVDLDPGPFFAARFIGVNVIRAERGWDTAAFCQVLVFFPLENVLSVYFMC